MWTLICLLPFYPDMVTICVKTMYHNIIDFQLQCETTHYLCNAPPPFPVEELVPEKLEGDVQPASQIPYPSYDQNLRYSLPYI